MDKDVQEKRNYERFDKEAQTFFYFHYDLSTWLDIGGAVPEDRGPAGPGYPACTKISAPKGCALRLCTSLTGANEL